MDEYLVPAGQVTFEQEIKKSRFITYLQRTEGINAAKAYINQIKKQHIDARHHCWAFVAGAPDDSTQLGFSDDGEPAGTAGKPILAQLIGSHLGEITAVVVRYYGGILLGTGGLVKAYGNGVQQALKQVNRQYKVLMRPLRVEIHYPDLTSLLILIEQTGAKIIASDYSDTVGLTVNVPQAKLTAFKKNVVDLTKGNILFKSL